MEFPQPIKKKAREASAFMCCLCHLEVATKIHHMEPKKGDGFENAAPLCAKCDELYAHTSKFKPIIIQARAWWFKHVEIIYPTKDEKLEMLKRIDKKTEEIDTKTDILPTMKPMIDDIFTKVNTMYDYFNDNNYSGVSGEIQVISGLVSTVSSGTAIVDVSGLVDSPPLEKKCLYCGSPLPAFPTVDNTCPTCGLPIEEL